jgi:hypothetical protein
VRSKMGSIFTRERRNKQRYFFLIVREEKTARVRYHCCEELVLSLTTMSKESLITRVQNANDPSC